MNQARAELARDGWREFFDKLTQEFDGYDLTIEVVGKDLGDQVEVDKRPLSYISYDEKDDVLIIAAEGRDQDDPAVRHMIRHPQRIYADTLTPEVPWAIDVVDDDGVQTIVTVHLRPSLPREVQDVP